MAAATGSLRRFVVPFGAAVAVLGVFLLVLGPARLARQLADANPAVFALGLGSILVALGCWSEASRRLFVAFETPLSRRQAFTAYGAGAFGKQVLPMGNAGGPAVMAYAFDAETDLGYSRSLAIVIIAEVLGLVASFLLGLVGIVSLLLSGSAPADLQWLGLGLVLLGAVVAAVGAVIWYRRRHVELSVATVARLLQPVVRRISPSMAASFEPDRVQGSVHRYYETFDTIAGDRRAVLSAFLFTQLGWVFFALPLFTGALALGVRLPLGLVLFLVPTAGLASVVPLPGGLGGVEVAMVGLLTVLAAVDLPTAGAVVLLFRLCSFWFFILVGGIAVSVATVGIEALSSST